jgi:hypothetical protein
VWLKLSCSGLNQQQTPFRNVTAIVLAGVVLASNSHTEGLIHTAHMLC